MAAPKRSNNLLIIIGLVFLLVGTGLVVVLLRSDDDAGTATSPAAGNELVPVLFSTRAIAKNALGPDLAGAVQVRQVPAVTRPADALVSLNELSDRTAVVDIGAEQPLRSAFFRQRTVRGATIAIPEGKQAIAVTVPFTAAVAGYVGQGDHVNVYALVTTRGDVMVPKCASLCDSPTGGSPQAGSRLVLSNVAVLDVSQEVAPSSAGESTTAATASSSARPVGPATITYLLALDAAQADRLVFFTSYASLYLSLVPKDQAASAPVGHDQSNALRP